VSANAQGTPVSLLIWIGLRIASTFRLTVELLNVFSSKCQVSSLFCNIKMFKSKIKSITVGGKQLTNKEEIRNLHWATWTGVLGPEVNGIWEKYTDTNDVNATDANFGGEVVVTGDDFGLVKLFTFPSLKKG
jgi:hypothetical protein